MIRLPASIRLTIRNLFVNTDPGTMFFLLGLPAVYLVILGVMFQSIIPFVPLNNQHVSYTSFLAPGIIAMQAFMSGSIGGGMLWADRRWGMFEQLMIGPFRRVDYLLGIMFVSMIFTLGGSLVMFIIAIFITGSLALTIHGALVILVVLILGSILFSSVFLILSVIIKTIQTYNMANIILFFVIDFASSAFYPITSQTPIALRAISSVNPLSYIVDVTRSAMVYQITYSTLVQIGIIALATVILFALSVLSYKKVKLGL